MGNGVGIWGRDIVMTIGAGGARGGGGLVMGWNVGKGYSHGHRWG